MTKELLEVGNEMGGKGRVEGREESFSIERERRGCAVSKSKRLVQGGRWERRRREKGTGRIE